MSMHVAMSGWNCLIRIIIIVSKRLSQVCVFFIWLHTISEHDPSDRKMRFMLHRESNYQALPQCHHAQIGSA